MSSGNSKADESDADWDVSLSTMPQHASATGETTTTTEPSTESSTKHAVQAATKCHMPALWRAWLASQHERKINWDDGVGG